jgi:hypothetical protein
MLRPSARAPGAARIPFTGIRLSVSCRGTAAAAGPAGAGGAGLALKSRPGLALRETDTTGRSTPETLNGLPQAALAGTAGAASSVKGRAEAGPPRRGTWPRGPGTLDRTWGAVSLSPRPRSLAA